MDQDTVVKVLVLAGNSTLLVFEPEGNITLNKFPGWGLPGDRGRAEDKDEIGIALRELKEETGLDIVIDYPDIRIEQNHATYRKIWLVGRPVGGQLKPDARWMPTEVFKNPDSWREYCRPPAIYAHLFKDEQEVKAVSGIYRSHITAALQLQQMLTQQGIQIPSIDSVPSSVFGASEDPFSPVSLQRETVFPKSGEDDQSRSRLKFIRLTEEEVAEAARACGRRGGTVFYKDNTTGRLYAGDVRWIEPRADDPPGLHWWFRGQHKGEDIGIRVQADQLFRKIQEIQENKK